MPLPRNSYLSFPRKRESSLRPIRHLEIGFVLSTAAHGHKGTKARMRTSAFDIEIIFLPFSCALHSIPYKPSPSSLVYIILHHAIIAKENIGNMQINRRVTRMDKDESLVSVKIPYILSKRLFRHRPTQATAGRLTAHQCLRSDMMRSGALGCRQLGSCHLVMGCFTDGSRYGKPSPDLLSL